MTDDVLTLQRNSLPAAPEGTPYEPVVLAFSPAEFFLLALLGITFIAFLSGGGILKGIIVGLFGLMLATVGMDPQTGTARYSGDYLFLWDGLSLVTAVIAIFAAMRKARARVQVKVV